MESVSSKRTSLIGEKMPYKVFCLIVFIIQTSITLLDFKLAQKHRHKNEMDATLVDILAGISWGMTALWWLFLAITSPIE